MSEPICPSCGAAFVADAAFCSRCGAPRAGATPAPTSPGGDLASFSGQDFTLTAGALGLFGRAIALTLAMFLIAPAPFALCWFYTWVVEKMQGRHGSRLSFHGTPGSVWVLTTLYGLLIVGGIAWSAGVAATEEPSEGAQTVFQIVNNLASVTIGFFLFRWMINSLALDGRRLQFTASFLKYLGWSILLVASVVTIIGWAWVACGMYRWLAATVEGASGRFKFTAKGHQFLGRTILYILFMLPIVTMPWAMRWFLAWFVEQFRFEEDTGAGEASPAIS